ncbi:hypothetical protein EDB89DRAFT_2015472 [Lactarius sanguifluus]|nr:hypothetical protein EDB89DRAFT_2022985 [Lactarius sanguifluus]KAH9164695.1 hypothetical protein EDB89DRAFT_2015472 [Lactarius sanguifluus]
MYSPARVCAFLVLSLCFVFLAFVLQCAHNFVTLVPFRSTQGVLFPPRTIFMWYSVIRTSIPLARRVRHMRH